MPCARYDCGHGAGNLCRQRAQHRRQGTRGVSAAAEQGRGSDRLGVRLAVGRALFADLAAQREDIVAPLLLSRVRKTGPGAVALDPVEAIFQRAIAIAGGALQRRNRRTSGGRGERRGGGGIGQRVKLPVTQPVSMRGWRVRAGGQPSTLKPTPVHGQHTDGVLSDWLGLNADDVGKLRADGALG